MPKLADGSKVLRITVTELGEGPLLADKIFVPLPQAETPSKFVTIPKIYSAFGNSASPRNPTPIDRIHLEREGKSLWIHLAYADGKGVAVLTTGMNSKEPQKLCRCLLEKHPDIDNALKSVGAQ